MNSRNSHQKNTIKLVWHLCRNITFLSAECSKRCGAHGPQVHLYLIPLLRRLLRNKIPMLGARKFDRPVGWVAWPLTGSCGSCRIVSIWNPNQADIPSHLPWTTPPFCGSLEGTDPPVINRRPSFAETTPAQADASVGNVTGSNSVNVFLGLGMSTSQITGAVVRWRNPGELAVSQPWTTVDGRWIPWIFESDSEDFSRWVILWLFYGYHSIY